MVFIDQLKKEHEVLRNLLTKLGSFKYLSNSDLENVESDFMKLYTLWNIHEKKEEENFSKIKITDVSMFIKKVFEDHKKLRPYKDAIYTALLEKDHDKIKETFRKNFEWLRDALLEHLTYEESYLFTRIEKYSDDELGFYTDNSKS